MEKINFTIPYRKESAPPHSADMKTMLKHVKQKLTTWLDDVEPKFTNKDALKLTSFEKKGDKIHISYEIVRDKWVTETIK